MKTGKALLLLVVGLAAAGGDGLPEHGCAALGFVRIVARRTGGAGG